MREDLKVDKTVVDDPDSRGLGCDCHPDLRLLGATRRTPRRPCGRGRIGSKRC